MEDYRPAKKQIEVSVGESVRIIRELQELSQNELARRTGIPQSTISAIENGRIRLGVERANEIARGKRGVTPETAWLFAQALDTSPEFWLNLQSLHDLARTQPRSGVSRLRRAG